MGLVDVLSSFGVDMLNSLIKSQLCCLLRKFKLVVIFILNNFFPSRDLALGMFYVSVGRFS